ncbi:MAG TPA: Ada metal-binding domain-containing protein, partial [Bryobacteraceae bacterium]
MKRDEQFWEAVQRRDRSADGRFFFGVVTTGVYCRPSCPSRRPLRKNVKFYESPQDAERDGLRPCLRCRPLERDRRIARLCRYIEQHCDENIDLAELAARSGLSRFHVQRAFKAAVGVSPKQYLEACRLR